MIHKLAGALPTLLLLVPSVGWGLGLGEIRLHSALNQPLVAEIELLSVKAREADDLRVTLAPAEVFARMGVDRPPLLSQLRFDVVKKAGSYVIEVRSDDPVREPFLDFLVEATWRSGRMLREYTLLLDPPDLVQEPPPRIQPARSPAAAPRRTAPLPIASPTASPTAAAANGAGELVYGPVKADETLWSIAKQVRPDRSVSVPQVMMALFKANPEAFEGSNINRLKEGYVLRVEDPALLRAMSKAEAAREMRRHSRQWEDYKLQAGLEGKTRPTQGTRGGQNALDLALAAAPEPHQLKLVAASKEKPADKPGSPGGAGADQAQEGGAIGQLRKELMLAQEASEAQRRDNEELRKRLEELESQLNSMQRLLALKDEDLAALQRQLRSQLEASAPPPVVAAEPQSVAAADTAEPKPQGEPAAADAAKPAAKPAATSTAEPEAVVVPEPLAGFLTDLLRDPTIVGALSIVGLSLATLLGLIIRRRRRGDDFQESILVGGTSSMLRAGADSDSGEHTSFLSEFEGGVGGGGRADEADVDPLTEADVYMAYGRYQQAEELLKDAIAQNPERKELRVKLLELYHTTKNRSAFEAQAGEAFALLGGGVPWDRVLAMGHELLPENPMFAAAPDRPVEIATGGAAVPEEEILDIGLDLDALGAEPETASAPAAGLDDLDLDLGIDFSDLEAFDAPAGTGEQAAEQPAAEDLFDLDFDPEPGAAAGPALQTAEGQAAEPEFELEFGDGGEHPPAPQAVGAGSAEVAPGGEWELESLFADADAVSASEASEGVDAQPPEPSERLADDWAGFDLDALIEKDLRPEAVAEESEQGWEMPAQAAEAELPRAFTAEALEPAEPAAGQEPAWDLDSLLAEAGAEQAGREPEQEADAADAPLEWDLSFDESPASSASEEGTFAEESPAGDFHLDLDGIEAPPAADDDLAFLEASLDRDLGVELGDGELFAGLDEVGTKLDLAKAYIDMGDGESARGILEEVIRDGNADQAQQAQELQTQIA